MWTLGTEEFFWLWFVGDFLGFVGLWVCGFVGSAIYMYLIHFKEGGFECVGIVAFFLCVLNMNEWALW